jgi:Icc protein
MKIIQITDLHVALEEQNSFGVDVRQNFLDILKAIRQRSPDLLVLTGDLCYDTGDEKVYRWMKSHLDFLGFPYVVIGGNHDDPILLAEVFEMEHLLVSGELYFKRWLGEQTVLFLESSQGFISPKQLIWLEHELSKLEGSVVVFMHYPPIFGGVAHMDDNYPLKNIQMLQDVFFAFPHHISLFCGHYHVEKVICYRNLTVHITPSTYFQINWRSAAFKVDHYRIALREITLRNDGSVESSVVYFDGNKG